MKKNINIELMQKNTLIEEQQSRIKELEKKNNEMKIRLEEISTNLIEK
jgi:hypothetical protein